MVSFTENINSEPLSGRLFLLLGKDSSSAPATQFGWNGGPLLFAADVNAWKPGETYIFHKRPMAYPTDFDSLESGRYVAQMVLNFNDTAWDFLTAPGNAWSQPQIIDLRVGDDSQEIIVKLDQAVPRQDFPEVPNIEPVSLKSELLSAFHEQEVHVQAAVILPEGYAENPRKNYPALYIIPGFGGTHFNAAWYRQQIPSEGYADKVLVVLNGMNYYGHHVFADSENTGPHARALVEEFIPWLAQQYRLINSPEARLLTGHSSGGWASLWLQVNYPEFFGGTWSTSPDPVDFRDFSGVNIYEDTSFFYQNGKGPRPLYRSDGQVLKTIKNFAEMEKVMGHGGQLGSFNAVFSDRNPVGQPYSLWDGETGKIRPEIARQWEAYDISLLLRSNWPELGPKLKGKLHIYTGVEDNFYLAGATSLLKSELEALGSDAVVEILPAKDHFNLFDDGLWPRMLQEMDEHLRQVTEVPQ